MHIDVKIDDFDLAEAAVLVLAATKAGSDSPTFRVYLDPARHPFRLIGALGAELDWPIICRADRPTNRADRFVSGPEAGWSEREGAHRRLWRIRIGIARLPIRGSARRRDAGRRRAVGR